MVSVQIGQTQNLNPGIIESLSSLFCAYRHLSSRFFKDSQAAVMELMLLLYILVITPIELFCKFVFIVWCCRFDVRFILNFFRSSAPSKSYILLVF